MQFWSTLISHSNFINAILGDSHLAFNFQKFTFGRLLSRIQFSEIHFLATRIQNSIFRNSLLGDSHLAFNFQKFIFFRLSSRIQFSEIQFFPTLIKHFNPGCGWELFDWLIDYRSIAVRNENSRVCKYFSDSKLDAIWPVSWCGWELFDIFSISGASQNPEIYIFRENVPNNKDEHPYGLYWHEI